MCLYYKMKYTHKFKKQESNKTRKIYAGDIDKNAIFRKILSIGYELETSTLAKLTLLENDNEKILLNTSSNSKDYDVIKRIQNDEATEEETEKYENRLEEMFDIDLYTSKSINKSRSKSKSKSRSSKSPGTLNANSTFIVANDVSVTPFTRHLNKLCNLNDEEGGEDLIEKDDLYTFETESGEKYKINFQNWDKQDCGTFADVEWIATYYSPKISENIILNTFLNVAKNLILHLNSLKKTRGKLIMNFNENDTEIIKKPENRVLYNLPGTNMHYLQTYLLNEEMDIDDICFVPQMTFSCRMNDIVDVFKVLIKDSLQVFEKHASSSAERVKLIERIETCVNKLVENYNKSVTKDRRIIENKNAVKSMKNCIFMMLFKLERYFDNYLQDEKVKNKAKNAKYLKDTLFFNSRHTNYELYKYLKQQLMEYFSIDEKEVISIIQSLIVQQNILEEYLIEDIKFVRKNAFSITNILGKTNTQYGNPYYSLISYLHFFEDPLYDDEDEIFYDWLEYKNIDIFSSTTAINKDVVLCEFRSFAVSIITYIYSIADDELKTYMTKGACNRIVNSFKPDITGITIQSLKKFISLYDKTKK
jgi:hypothetical protein